MIIKRIHEFFLPVSLTKASLKFDLKQWLDAAETLVEMPKIFRFFKWRSLFLLARALLPRIGEVTSLEFGRTVKLILQSLIDRSDALGEFERHDLREILACYQEACEVVGMTKTRPLWEEYGFGVWGIGEIGFRKVLKGYPLPPEILSAIPVPILANDVTHKFDEKWYNEWIRSNELVEISQASLGFAHVVAKERHKEKCDLPPKTAFLGEVKRVDERWTLAPIEEIESLIVSAREWFRFERVMVAPGQRIVLEGETAVLSHASGARFHGIDIRAACEDPYQVVEVLRQR